MVIDLSGPMDVQFAIGWYIPVLATCVLAIPIAALVGDLKLTGILLAVVGLEVATLAFNDGRCPLQDIAARYTDDRSGNFDIYLPAWLAARTMIIFGPLLLAGIAIAAFRWAAQ